MLALADKRGIVEGSVPGLADLCRVSVEECREGLEKLKAPDPDSRTKDQGGRRIVEVEGGWQLVNHAKYRAKLNQDERREYLRIKKQESRVNKRREMSTPSTQPEADPEASKRSLKSQKQVPPSREEVGLLAAKAGLPIEQADAFWEFYDSKGWMVGKNKMVSVASAVAGWARRWRTEQQTRNDVSPTTLAILHQKELDEVVAKMKSIRGSYSEHQDWSEDDKARWYKLKARKDELKKLLGMQV